MTLSYVVFQELDHDGKPFLWTAMGLNYSFFGSSESQDGAVDNLRLSLRAERMFAEKDGRAPFEGIAPASEDCLAWVKREELLVYSLLDE